jgi:hypothetical protein
MLHAVVTANLLMTIGALVDNILAGIHAKWDQTTPKPATYNSNDEACYPGQGSRLVVGGGHNISLTKLTLDAHWGFTEMLDNGVGWLTNNHSGSLLGLLPITSLASRSSHSILGVVTSWLLRISSWRWSCFGISWVWWWG